MYFALFIILIVKSREKFEEIEKGRGRKSLGSPVLNNRKLKQWIGTKTELDQSIAIHIGYFSY